jgi:hypothetical protein
VVLEWFWDASEVIVAGLGWFSGGSVWFSCGFGGSGLLWCDSGVLLCDSGWFLVVLKLFWDENLSRVV